MLVLGIESTCDETSAAVVQDGRDILSHVIASQITVHQPFGGVVPELASRHHIDDCLPTIQTALHEAHLSSLEEIDVIAVAEGPGLVGSLLVGIQTAKALAWSSNTPLVGVNHVEAHLYAAMMSKNCSKDLHSLFPALGVVLSGGHTSIITIHDIGVYTLIGQTVDDAIGEAFDKVAKIMGFPYPGGPRIELLAQSGNPFAYPLKAGQVKSNPFHFSFSGLKTGVLYTFYEEQKKATQEKRSLLHGVYADIAASFQHAAFSDIVQKMTKAIGMTSPKAIFLGGGVTNNKALIQLCQSHFSIPVFCPEPQLCLDNAAMIAGLGYQVYKKSDMKLNQTHSLQPKTRIPFLT